MTTARLPGEVIGRAATGLGGDTSWAANEAVVRMGAKGEVMTAAVLDARARELGGPTVLHDLRIPLPGVNANIDHVVVSGRTILIVDSKVWKPGFYWTLAGVTRRGWTKVPHVDKRTCQMARDALEKFLAQRGAPPVRFQTPVLAVWSSSAKAHPSLWAARGPGIKILGSATFIGRLRRLAPRKPADPAVVVLLAQLVNT